MERERLLNIPNALTVLRIVLIVGFVILHFVAPGTYMVPMIVFICAGLTDFLDGYIARRLNQVTWLGKLLDPLADKIMILSALLCLMFSGIVPGWVLAMIIIKELYVVTGATILFRQDFVVSSDIIGKVSTFLFIPAVMLLYPWHQVSWLHAVGGGLMAISIALSYAAALQYTIFAVKKSRELKTD